MNIIKFKISAKIERHIRKGHPWLFDNSITKQTGEGVPGDIAVIYDHSNKFLAIGLYDPLSTIRVRILQANEPAVINEAFFEARLKEAFNIRLPLLGTNTTGYRLIHGENDGFPGLVLDKYDKTFVIKIYSAIWVPHLNDLIKKITTLMPVERVVFRCSRNVLKDKKYLNGMEEGMVLYGPGLEGPVIFYENGLKFESDVVNGQKTGFFLDQRENRAKVGGLSAGKKVLNVFSYTGGFSLYASAGGASSVLSIDINHKALEAFDRNLKLNNDNENVRKAKNDYIKGDAFIELSNLQKRAELFDVVIIDPPSFAKKESEVEEGIKAYEALARLGITLVRKGGLYVQSSCSSRISSLEFYSTVTNAISAEGYHIQEIERTGHPLDHPIKFIESEYLKTLFAKRN